MIIKRELHLKVVQLSAWSANERYYEIGHDITILKTDDSVVDGILTEINEDNVVIKKDNTCIKVLFESIEKIEDTDWLCEGDIRES